MRGSTRLTHRWRAFRAARGEICVRSSGRSLLSSGKNGSCFVSHGIEGLKRSGDRVVSSRGMTLSPGLGVKSRIAQRLDIRFSSRGYSFVGEVESLVAEGLPEVNE